MVNNERDGKEWIWKNGYGMDGAEFLSFLETLTQ